jgi:hypothetical protein
MAKFVPVESLTYVPSDAKFVGAAVAKLLPRLLTSTRRMILFNNIWKLVPVDQEDIVRCCQRNHVFLAQAAWAHGPLKNTAIPCLSHLITITSGDRFPIAFHVNRASV